MLSDVSIHDLRWTKAVFEHARDEYVDAGQDDVEIDHAWVQKTTASAWHTVLQDIFGIIRESLFMLLPSTLADLFDS